MSGARQKASPSVSKPKSNFTQAKLKFKEGIRYHISQRYEKAVQCYNEAIAINPNYAMAYSNKGISLDELGKKQEAIKAYNRAIEINPKFTDAYVNKGTVLNELGKNIESIACYDKAISIDKNYTGAYYNKGNALKCQAQYEKVIDNQEIVIKLDPNHDLAHFAKAVALHCLGRPMESILWFDKTIKLDPKNAQPYSEKAVVLRTLGRFHDAISYHDKALEIDPEYSLAYYYKGDCQKALERYQEAMVCFDKAIKLEPKEILFYCNKSNSLNMIEENWGRVDEADMGFEIARSLLVCEDETGMEGYGDLDQDRQNLVRELVKVSVVKINPSDGEKFMDVKVIRDSVVNNLLVIINDKTQMSKIELEQVYNDLKYLWELIHQLAIDIEPKAPKKPEPSKEDEIQVGENSNSHRSSFQNKVKEKRKEHGGSSICSKSVEYIDKAEVPIDQKEPKANDTENQENLHEIKIEEHQPFELTIVPHLELATNDTNAQEDLQDKTKPCSFKDLERDKDNASIKNIFSEIDQQNTSKQTFNSENTLAKNEEVEQNINVPKKKNSSILQNHTNGYNANIMISTQGRKSKIKEHDKEFYNIKPEEDDFLEEIKVTTQTDVNKFDNSDGKNFEKSKTKKKKKEKLLNTKMFFQDDDGLDFTGGLKEFGRQSVDITESFLINSNKRMSVLSTDNQTPSQFLVQDLCQKQEYNIESQCVNLADDDFESTKKPENNQKASTTTTNIDDQTNNTNEVVIPADLGCNTNTNNRIVGIKNQNLNRKKQEPIDVNPTKKDLLDNDDRRFCKQTSLLISSSTNNNQTASGGCFKKNILRHHSDVVSMSLVSGKIKQEPIANKENHVECIQVIDEIVNNDNSKDKVPIQEQNGNSSNKNFVIKNKPKKTGWCFGMFCCSAGKKK